MALWKIEPTINNCRENLVNGFIGQVEYHLFKDSSWIAWLYRNDEEKEKIIAELKKIGYSIDKVCDFKNTIVSLTNNIEIKLN